VGRRALQAAFSSLMSQMGRRTSCDACKSSWGGAWDQHGSTQPVMGNITDTPHAAALLSRSMPQSVASVSSKALPVRVGKR
jgi:hypothetical protein